MKKGYKNIAGLENLTVAQIRQRNLETYGESVKKYRMKAGMTVDQLADILQISKSSVRNWECGVARPDPEYLYRMFTILDVEPNEFFGIGGPKMQAEGFDARWPSELLAVHGYVDALRRNLARDVTHRLAFARRLEQVEPVVAVPHDALTGYVAVLLANAELEFRGRRHEVG